MRPGQLQKLIYQALVDAKAQDIAVLDVSKISDFTDWNTIASTEHAGESGVARWRTRQCGDIRVRMVEYSPGYVADHWCTKGHVLLCLNGSLETELADGRRVVLTPGMSYQVADGA